MRRSGKMVIVALRKEHKRFAVRMCREFEMRGISARLVSDVVGLLAAERETSPDVVILDAVLSEPKTADVIASLHADKEHKLILLDLPAEQEPEIRNRWPLVELIV